MIQDLENKQEPTSKGKEKKKYALGNTYNSPQGTKSIGR